MEATIEAELSRLALLHKGESVTNQLRGIFADLEMSDIYRDREKLARGVQHALRLPADTKQVITDVVRSRAKCYAGLLGTMRCWHKGHARIFDKPQQFPGRMAEAAKWAAPAPKEGRNKPWLSGLPRLIFVSDMGDALSRDVPFDYLRTEIINTVNSVDGQRHIWLWLTKRPTRMADFGSWLQSHSLGWPRNLVAMTTVTGPDTVARIKALLRVPAACRALSLEPLFGRMDLQLDGIDWVIVGGGSDVLAKPFHVEWALEIREKCHATNVAYFLKQLGRSAYFNGKPLPLNNPHGGDWNEWSPGWRTREMPGRFADLAPSSMNGQVTS